MSSRWPLLMPVAALLLVVLIGGAVFALRDDGSSSAPGPATQVSPKPSEPAASELSPSVCRGASFRRSADEPRVFHESYTQRIQVKGIYIVGSALVAPEAFDEARKTLEVMFAGNQLADELAAFGAYIVIADSTQLNVLDLPEFGCLASEVGAARFTHVCGVADAADYPVATVNELDLLGDRRGPCRGLNILYHEVGHLVMKWTLAHPDYLEIRQLYQAAIDAGLYRGDYASTNANEYFAEAVQAFFLHVDARGGRDRAWLARYDPPIYDLLVRVFEAGR
jgi:hypothetical protein